MKTTIRIHCNDQSGIVSAVTAFIHAHGGNIVYLDQHVDQQTNAFFMRIESIFKSELCSIQQFKQTFTTDLATKYQMNWSIHEKGIKPKMALFVSKYDHCLYDLLSRYRSGELEVDIPIIISNHKDLSAIAKQFDIAYYHIAISKSTKKEAEDQQLALLAEHKVDFIVLARYMQIVSAKLIAVYPNKIINIHHSFLPAFAGAKPYHAAFKRGVKIIGATSHYVTEALDEGPIIAQDVTTVTHTHSIADFIAKGRDLEKIVLARAVRLHLQRKTMVYANKTVIFY